MLCKFIEKLMYISQFGDDLSAESGIVESMQSHKCLGQELLHYLDW